MKMMIMLSMMMNTTFLTSTHPMSMGLLIIMQTIMIAMITGMMFKSFWYSYILLLMFVGGMMVLFIYMTSLTPNIMFKYSNKKIIIMIMTIIMMMIMMKNMDTIMINNDSMNNFNEMMLMNMYELPNGMSIILLASYLLFTMITVFKITELKKGSLQMKI
nr:NADH dehydrogenase subunit 6 [Nanhuaphasma hamicercum]